jgi:hypothetical protein
MMKTMSRLLVTAAAASMAFAPIAAQANTRAGDSTSVYAGVQAAPGFARADDGEDMAGKPGAIILALLAAAAAITGIVFVSSQASSGQSPGT